VCSSALQTVDRLWRRHRRSALTVPPAYWTGAAMYCESAETTFDATGVAMCTAQLTGVLVFA
jgi:hypothetical protein